MPFHRDHVFRAQRLRLAVDLRVGIRVENHLGDAVAVPHVDEDDPAEIVTAVDPAHQKGARALVGGAQLAARVRAPQFAEKIQRIRYPACSSFNPNLSKSSLRVDASAVRPWPYP